MDECKALLEAIKAEQEKTNIALNTLILLLGGVLNG
jgi:hypothetical protein